MAVASNGDIRAHTHRWLSDSSWVVTVSAMGFIVVVRVAVWHLERSAARLMASHDAKIVAEFELEDKPPAARL